MASAHRNPRGPAQPPRIPRGFGSSDPERQGQVAPQGREKDEAVRDEDDRPRRSPDSDDEGCTRRR